MVMARDHFDDLSVCRITWAESMAAFAQRSRIRGANQSMLAQAKSALVKAWSDFAIADVNQPLVEKAGVYAEAFALRGYGSVQLAAAPACRSSSPCRSPSLALTIASTKRPSCSS
jgi:hypothetical protein